MMKKTLSVLLAVLLLFGTVATGLSATAEGENSHIVAEGDCGWNAAASIPNADLHWTLTSKGTLTVTGAGEMKPCYSFCPIWNDCMNPETGEIPAPVRIIIIEPGAANISHYACSYAVELETILIPDTVTSIDPVAFEACDALKSVFYTGTEEQWQQIEGVEVIGEDVTVRCNIVEWGFCGSKRVSNTDYSGDNSNLLWTQNTDGQVVVSGAGEMSSGSLNCSPIQPSRYITSAVVEADLEMLPYSAFSGCSSMTSAVLTEGLKTIDGYAFEHCSKLTSVTIPASVTQIHSHGFFGCYRLTDVYYGGTREQWKQIDFGEPSTEERTNYNEEYLFKAHIHYLAEPDNISWSLEDGVLTISGTGAIWPTVETETQTYETWDSATQTWKMRDDTHTVQHYPWDPSNLWGSELEAIAEIYGIIPADVLGLLVKKIVIEEGITEINGSAFELFAPETVVLPASLERLASIKIRSGDSSWYESGTAFELHNLKDLYIGNPDAVFRPAEELFFEDGYQLELYGAVDDYTFESYEDYRTNIISYSEKLFQLLGMSGFIACGSGFDALLTIYEVRHQAKMHTSSSYYVNEDAVDVFFSRFLLRDAETWELGGLRYDTYDHFEADVIAAINTLCGTDFSSIEELFVLIPAEAEGEKPTAENSEALNAALQPFIDEYTEIETAVHVDDYFFGGAPIAKHSKGWNQETQSNEYEEIPVTPLPWVTVHGYSGSTAETAAAASSVKFVPFCPVNYTHTVTEKDETAPTCTEPGHTAGLYCEDCGVWMTGEAIDPAGHLHQKELPRVLPREDFSEHGHEAGVWCEDCETWLSGGETIHNRDGDCIVVREPTADEMGEVKIQCTACGEWGLYEVDKLEPGETPDDPGSGNPGGQTDGGSQSSEEDNSFLARLRRAARGFIETLLRLIRWLGGKK